jgi:hypothetical protein
VKVARRRAALIAYVRMVGRMRETPLIPVVVDDESVREARKGLERFGFIAETFESATWPCKCLA